MSDLVYLAKMSVNFCTLSSCTSCLISLSSQKEALTLCCRSTGVPKYFTKQMILILLFKHI